MRQTQYHRGRRQPRGFTLLEILVALAIFVGAAAALSRLVMLGIENAEYSQWQTQAWTLIESRFDELDAGILTLDNVGTIPIEEAPGWQCTMTSESTDLTGLYSVTLEMRNVSGERGEGFTFRATRLYFDETSVDTSSSPSASGSTTGSSAGAGAAGAGS